ncbi:MAG: hypothetical protein ACRD3M_11955, partial [Thermoanaerobaculia bacterium]
MKNLPTILVAPLLFLVPTVGQTQPVETELEGVTAEVVELRQAGGVLRLAIRFTNGGAAAADPSDYGVDRITLVDVKSKKKHFPLRDANSQYLAGPFHSGSIWLSVPVKKSAVLWAYFEPVAIGTVMNVEVPYVFPFENVPVTEAPSKVFA